MRTPSLVSAPAGPAGSSRASATRLSGRWLLLARVVCAAGALLAVGLFTLGLLMRFTHLNRLSTFDVPDGWNPTAFQAALTQLGLSVGFYQMYRTVVDLILVLCCFLVAALLLWRKSNEWMALFVAMVLITFGAIWPTNTDGLAVLYPAWSWLFTNANQLSIVLLAVFFFLFPDGRFVPRWTRWLWVAVIALLVLEAFFPALPAALGVLQFFGGLAAALVAQMYRYQRRASPLQRQQIKWVVFGFSATFAAIVGFLVLELLFPALGQPGTAGVLYQLVGDALGNIWFLPIPVCVGMALLRYRLWDVDSLINKALVYGGLSALLASFYVGLIIGLTSLFGLITGQTAQPLVLVVSTLAIAALFLPLRRRIQAIIDRRFYRQKYDAAKTLEAFSATLRQELDLEQLREQVLAVVQETMRPTHVSLWLRSPQRPTSTQARIERSED
jgi:hypothetical protein